MNTGSKLLRKIYIRSFDIFKFLRCEFKHYYYDAPFSTSHMYGLARKQVFLRNFCESISISKALTLSYCNFMGTMANSTAKQPFGQAPLEPFVETYYNSSNNHEIPFPFPLENLECESNTQPLGVGSNTCINPTMLLKDKYMEDKQRYEAMRYWKRIVKEKLTSNSEEFFVLRVLSFNILAQYLLETYPFLYKEHDKRALSWNIRRQLLLQEILGTKANIICLQEMQEDHLNEFLVPFKELGYAYLYKKRTNEKKDGLLFLYRSDQFILLEHVKVELYQSGIELLSRDNVGIVAKLAVKENPETQLVIATTHLLYNPRRNDVRLGQSQLLLAEIERIAFLENTPMGSKYLPVILTGDFNLEPNSGVYQFITKGSFEYQGKGRNLEPTEYRTLSNSLIPPRLYITDNCQHFNILRHRLRGNGPSRVMLENSENMNLKGNSSNASRYSEVNTDTTDRQIIEVVPEYRVQFCSGTLTHPFHFQSVYNHQQFDGRRECTTHQDNWITVDYIFYSDLTPIEKYKLPTAAECATLPTIPNFAVGSDHFCLGATFKINKKKV